ncbi:MAG: hypothetical protein ACFFC7_01370 [Candidatus Hermodarchaeota archaeon]
MQNSIETVKQPKQQLQDFLKRVKDISCTPEFATLLLLVVIAAIIRFFFAFLFRGLFGDPLPFQLLDLDTECYADFYAYYSLWIPGLWDGTWYPYMTAEGPVTSLVYTTFNLPWGPWIISFGEGVPQNYYFMTPGFLYFLLPFGHPLFSPQLMSIPLILTDTLTIIPLYLIIKELGKNDRLALYGALLYLFSPLNIFYLGVIWLSTGPVVFLLMWSLYFLVNRNYRAANFCFALTVMTKQITLFFLLPFYVLLLLKFDWKTISKRFIEFSIVCFILSLPYILLTPIDYVLHIWGPQPLPSTQGYTDLPRGDAPVNFQHFLLALNFDSFFGGIFYQLFTVLFSTYILLIGSILLVSAALIYYYKRDQLTELNICYVFCIYGLTFHTFFVRGIYKYYLPLLTPLIIITGIFLLHHFLNKKSLNQNRDKSNLLILLSFIGLAILFLALGILFIIIPKNFGPFLLFITLLSIIVLIFGKTLREEFISKIGAKIPRRSRVMN